MAKNTGFRSVVHQGHFAASHVKNCVNPYPRFSDAYNSFNQGVHGAMLGQRVNRQGELTNA